MLRGWVSIEDIADIADIDDVDRSYLTFLSHFVRCDWCSNSVRQENVHTVVGSRFFI